ncbi:Acyl-[acyl-carrier-protein]--UDP-N-acetylglucosamine O-acyltransferase [Gimesia chilikensis]|uniref:Acyl-[acyl-carrier-protein]--UDP-N-acetylglucosamine O-acyltransferase n=1 Tax=Gimesia chilikensis TaxID=2605989 RepID=A0A517WDK3_9PLAN|nr:acyl-ACP--UDP-N-acetylglucosamine O-acyltransferase [Gimesia chilikensis]QDU03318.1 Acyl-[acyl-carrier-protein]--UDP-N-acetylglucosamine O-acyltransferase [Gimesia chilikensis]
MRVHPTAYIHPDAVVHPTCDIGPHVVIEGPVHIGANCHLGPSVVVMGNTDIGSDCQIHAHAVIGDTPQDRKYTGAISYCRIGQRCLIRESVTIHRACIEQATTVVGNDCHLMTCSHVAHDCILADEVTLVSGALLGGHVQIGPQAIISGNVGIHQFVRVGQLAMLGGVAMISRDVPPFTMTDHQGEIIGLNAVGLARRGISTAEQQDLKTLFKVVCRSGMSHSRSIELAAELAQTDIGRQFVEFFQAETLRGFSRFRGKKSRSRKSLIPPVQHPPLAE